jgi:hypothetical protein
VARVPQRPQSATCWAARIGGMLQGDSARADHVARGGGHSRMAAECPHFLQQNVRIFGHEILTPNGSATPACIAGTDPRATRSSFQFARKTQRWICTPPSQIGSVSRFRRHERSARL